MENVFGACSGIGLDREIVVVADVVTPKASANLEVGPMRDQLERVFNDYGLGMVLLKNIGQIFQVNKAFSEMLVFELE